jgi:hypothetical protein
MGYYQHLKNCPVNPSSDRISPHPGSGPYRDEWDKDPGYRGHLGSIQGHGHIIIGHAKTNQSLSSITMYLTSGVGFSIRISVL